MVTEFSQAVIEKISFYVYSLIDPRSKKVFYIRKGKGNRVFSHLNAALETPLESDKLVQIREIIQDGFKPEHFIIRHNITEREAFEIESTLIDFARLCENYDFKLTNLIKGIDSYDRGVKTITDIIQFYDAHIITIEEPTLIIVVNKHYLQGMSAQDLYNVVHEKWVLHPNRIRKIKYVIAGYFGIVREVYEVDNWYPTYDEVSQKDRYGFNGKIAKSDIRDKYINQSLVNYKSGGNPIRYVNC